MDDNRSWVNIEIASEKLGCGCDKVKSLIKSGKLQSKPDSFGSTLVSVCSIRAAAGGVQLRGVK